MDEKQLQFLFNEYAKGKGFKDYDDFKSLMLNDDSRRIFFDESNKELGFKNFEDFDNTLGVKKKSTSLQPSPSSATPSLSQLSEKSYNLQNQFQPQGENVNVAPKQQVKNKGYLDLNYPKYQPTPQELRMREMGVKSVATTTNKEPNIEEAINNAVQTRLNQYKSKSGGLNPTYNIKDEVIRAYKEGDLVPVKENGKSVMKRGAGFFGSFFDAVEQNHAQNLENDYVATLPKEKAINYLNAKITSPESFENKRETAPSGFLGKVGEFLGENIPMLTKATTGAIGGTALAPETGGASFGMFLANARDMANAGYAQALERNYRGIKEQNPEISDSEAYDKANKAALAGEVTSLATNAVFSYAAPKNIQLPSPTVETNGFINSLTHAIKSYPKVGATAAAGSVINDIASNLAGNKVEAEQMGENAIESAKEMAVMHFGLWALGQPFKIPSYLRPQAENIVASAPREEVRQFYKGMEERGVFPEGTADKVVDKLNQFEEQKQVVNGMDLNEEQKASITGKLLQRKKIEEENRELKKYGGSFNTRVEANDKAIEKLDAEIDGIIKTGDVQKFEKDNLTGETPNQIGKAVEEQLKPVEEPKVKEEVPIEEVKAEPTKPLTNEEKVKQLRAEEQAEYDAMTNPKDEVKRKEIYDKYDKLITPLLEAEKKEVNPKEQAIIDAHKKTDEYISEAQDAYDKAQAERLEYIKKNGYPIGNDPEFDKLVSAKVNAEDKLNRLKKAKENLLPLPKSIESKEQTPSALRDVESTAKALEVGEKDLDKQKRLAPKIKKIFNVYFHGTNNDNIKFDENSVFYGTKDEKFADTYGVNIIPAVIELKNPYDLSESIDGKILDENGEPYKDNNGVDYSYNYVDNSLKEKLKQRGYDGILMGGDVIAFDKSQVKSLSEAYHKAKKDGSNPELVKAVESLLSKEQTKEQTLSEFEKAKQKERERLKEKPTIQIETKEIESQVKDFGVSEKMAKPVTNVIEKIFDGLKKAGLTKAENAKEWIGISKGKEEKSYALKINGKEVQVKSINPEVVNGFYSPLEKTLIETKFDKLPSKQWIEKFGKSEEAKWTGLSDWLSQQQGSVSKADIQQYLKDNRIEVVEVVKGSKYVPNYTIENEPPTKFGATRNDLLGALMAAESIDNPRFEKYLENRYGNGKELLDWLKENTTEKGSYLKEEDTKFGNYQLEGEKENYKEILVTLPSRVNPISVIDTRSNEIVKTFKVYSDAVYFVESNRNGQFYDLKEDKTKTFKSSHFDEPNILVHLRMNTRKDSQGNKVLFLEEIQSDWGQKGKKEGFNEPIDFKRIESVNYKGYTAEVKGKTLSIAEMPNGKFNTTIDGNFNGSFNTLQEAKNNLSTLRDTAVSSAPFVTDTNSWTKLGLKVALKEAVKQGVDKIAWTTGEQQNDRYDLSKQVDEITYSKYPDGTYQFSGSKNDNQIFNYQRIPENKLEDYVGKEVAKKIIDGEGDVMSYGNKEEGTYGELGKTLSGIDLKVGGKGMKGFYGSPTEGSLGIVGNVAKSLFKQEPKTLKINVNKYLSKQEAEKRFKKGETLFVETKDKGEYEVVSLIDVDDAFDNGNRIFSDSDLSEGSNQQSIDITPELRAQVEKGQPLFKDSQAQYRIESGKNIIESIKNFNGSEQATVALTHEIMHPTVVSIIDGAKEKNQVGLKHTKTIVNEFNKAYPNSKITIESLVKGNDNFKQGKTSKEYRAVQEFIAEAWEKYNTKGTKGFSKPFQEVLNQITEAFKSVYNSLTGKELTPQLSKMFDEILGKELKTDYSKGKLAEIPEGTIFKSEKEADSYIIENSENPAQIAEIYARQKPEVNLSSEELMIAEYGIGKIKGGKNGGYAEFGDPNNMTMGKAKAYISKNGANVDVLAKELSDHYDYEISPEDIINFIDKFPNGVSSALAKRNNQIAIDARNKFYELTGKSLTPKIAEKAINYEFDKLNKQIQKFAYEQWKSEQELTDEYWRQYNATDGFTKESNITEIKQGEKAPSRGQQNLAEKARKLAADIRAGEKKVIPDWLKADLPSGTKLSGVSFEEAAAKSLEIFADVYDKVSDAAQAISEAVNHLKEWHKENNIAFDEEKWTRKFEENLLPKEKKRGGGKLEVGISHENLNKLAKKFGLKEINRGKRLPDEVQAERGRLLYNEGEKVYGKDNFMNQLESDFENGMMPTPDDVSIVRAHIEYLANETNNALLKFGKKSEEFKTQSKELEKWLLIEKDLGTKSGNLLATFSGKRDLDTDSFVVVRRSLEKQLGGAEISVEQEKKIEELTNQNLKLKERAEKAEKAAIEATDKLLGKETKKTFTESAKKIADDFRKLKTKEFKFRDENGNEIDIQKAGVSWNDLVEVGAQAIEKTGEIADGVAAIVDSIKDKEWYKKLSDKDKNNLEAQLTNHFEDAIKNTPEAEQKEERLKKLQERFLNKTDNKFTPEDKKEIWKYAKEEYLNNGVKYQNMISLVANDIGLRWRQVLHAIATTETKQITDEMWKAKSDYRKNQNATKRWVEEQNKNPYVKGFKEISNKVRGISVFGHGGIFVGTHAAMTLFNPSTWNVVIPAFFRAWRYAYGNKVNYEMEMQELKDRPNYLLAQRAGLKNDPDTINFEEFQKSQNFLGKLGGAGVQGFNALKVLRQDLFDRYWDRLTEAEKLEVDEEGTPIAAKNIAKLMNNATGATNLKVSEAVNEITFAGGMEVARWGKLTRNPAKAADIAIKALRGKATLSEKVFAKVWASRVGEQLATYSTMLLVNAAIQNMIDDKNKVNFTDPKKSDFLKPKFGDIAIDATSGQLGVMNFIKNLWYASTMPQEELNGDTRAQKWAKEAFRYGRGKLAPFYSKIADIAWQTDYSGNPLPFSSDKPREGKHKLTWMEYAWQSAPLPIAEAAHEMYQSAAENGGDPKIVDGLIMAAISGGTGLKPSEPKERPTLFTEEDKKTKEFKYFIDKGLKLPEVPNNNVEIKDEKLKVKKPLSEYPKETIDKYNKKHKGYLKQELKDIIYNGSVFIDKFGDISLNQNESGELNEISLKKLNKEQLAQVLSIAQRTATEKTKKDIFNQ